MPSGVRRGGADRSCDPGSEHVLGRRAVAKRTLDDEHRAVESASANVDASTARSRDVQAWRLELAGRGGPSPPRAPACSVESVTRCWPLAVLLAVLTTLVSPRIASASSAVQPETRVGGFDLVALPLVGLLAAPSAQEHEGNAVAYDETARGYSLAAEGVELTGTALARQLGSEGELAANILKNTERIPSLTGTAAYRIPDVLSQEAGIIGEVKNVANLSYTNQLRDFAMYAQQNGYQFQLFVRPTTVLSGPLQAEIQGGNIVLQFLP